MKQNDRRKLRELLPLQVQEKLEKIKRFQAALELELLRIRNEKAKK